MSMCHECPFTPQHSPRHLADNLTWWKSLLARPELSREIPSGRHFTNVSGFSDASSIIGVGIVLGDRWRAWRLLPGWNEDGRDIGWAEVVGMELLIRSIVQYNAPPGIKIFGDNNGVIKGWWTGRSQNSETNRVFRRIHKLLEECDAVLTTRYINTTQNPADSPSRGIYPPEHLLLWPIKLPAEIRRFIVNYDSPLRPDKSTAAEDSPPEPKSALPLAEHHRRRQANHDTDDKSEAATQMPLFADST